MNASRKFPYLSAYLQKLDDEAGRALVSSVPIVASTGSALMGTLVFVLMGLLFGKWGVGIFLGVLLAGMVILSLTAAARRRKLLSDPREQRRRLVFKTGKEIRDLEIQRKLHQWMDPVALHLLEAGAYHYARIQTTLSGPQWGTKDLPVYWAQLKAQVSEASQEGMADLLILTRNCVGPPQKDRSSDIQGVVESFVELDIAEGMRGVKELAKADWTAYAHQSPQAEAVAIHGRRIAEKLRELADDVEAKGSEIAIEAATSGGFQSIDALEGVLGELRTVRQAESELGEQHIEQRF